jgi:hypothetical protein
MSLSPSASLARPSLLALALALAACGDFEGRGSEVSDDPTPDASSGERAMPRISFQYSYSIDGYM